MNGFDLVARCLQAEGVTWLACFPMNPLIESAAKIGIRPIVFRQERSGINAADGFSRQTAGKQIGIFASQHGPGVENSFGGIAQAWADSVPLIYLPGGGGTTKYDIAPNFSATRNYGGITKLAISLDQIDRITTQMRRAFHAVMSLQVCASSTQIDQVPRSYIRRAAPSTVMSSTKVQPTYNYLDQHIGPNPSNIGWGPD